VLRNRHYVLPSMVRVRGTHNPHWQAEHLNGTPWHRISASKMSVPVGVSLSFINVGGIFLKRRRPASPVWGSGPTGVKVEACHFRPAPAFASGFGAAGAGAAAAGAGAGAVFGVPLSFSVSSFTGLPSLSVFRARWNLITK
jgi:hypothetical protein